MNLKKIINNFNYFNFINFYKQELLNKLLLFKYYNKKRIILRNSFHSDFLLEDFFKKSLNFEKLRNIFFNKQLFAYAYNLEKEKIIEYLKENCAIDIRNYIEYADKIIRKELSIFEKTYRFKNKLDWYYSFLDNFKWILEKSENINIRPNIKEIDVKYVWELNRHQFLIYLGFAYYFSENEIYAKEFKQIILDWIKKNPPLCGINWYSGLEISIRLISWIFSLNFFKDSKEINNNDFFKKIFTSMFQHAYYLRYFYSHRKFNHTVGDIFGVYLFSKIFEVIKPIKRWERKFFKKFKRQILLQTRPDGTNIEQSVNYHRFVLEFFSLFILLNPNALNEEEQIQINKMYDFLLYIIKPNGDFPLIGDFDDGKILLLTFYKNNPFIDLINLGSILFQRGDLKYISKNISPISILLLGTRGYEIYNKIKVQEPYKKFKYFKNAGYIVIRNNWSDKANFLFIDFGRFGAQKAGHSHSSITNFIYCYKGKNIINDSGTYTYNKSWKERNLFRSSKAHNILTIDQKNQAKIKSWFEWENKSKLKRVIHIKDDEIELTCIHNGYEGFLVKRKIITNNNLTELQIKDKVIPLNYLKTNEIRSINIYLHFDNSTKFELLNNSVIINDELKIEISSEHNFIMKLEKFFYSPLYGIKNECPMLNIYLKNNFNGNEIIEIEIKIKALG